MRPVTVRLLLGAAAGLLLLVGCSGNQKFETSSLQSKDAIDAKATSYWKKHGWWSMPKDGPTLAITEFSVEYVTGTGAQNQGLGLIGVGQMMGMGKKQMNFDEKMKQELPGKLYAQYVTALQAQGWKVAPTEALTNTEGYKQLKGLKDGKGTKRSEGYSGGHSYQKGQIYAANELMAVDSGFWSSFSNPKHEASAVADAGAQVGLRVRIRCGIDDKGRACLYQGSTIYAFKIATTENKGQKQHWHSALGTIESTKGLFFDEPVVTGKQFQAFKGDVYTVDPAAFENAVAGVFPTFAELSAARLKK